MKKMYKKPITEEILVDTKLMDSSLGVSGGGTAGLGDDPIINNAPKRRLF